MVHGVVSFELPGWCLVEFDQHATHLDVVGVQRREFPTTADWSVEAGYRTMSIPPASGVDGGAV